MIRQIIIAAVLCLFIQQAQGFWAIKAHRGRIKTPGKIRIVKPRKKKMKIYGVHS